MFALKNNPQGVKYLKECFGGTHLQISPDYWVWVPGSGTTLHLDKVETTPTKRTEYWKFNDEEFVIERYDTHDEIYQPIKW